MVARPQGTPCTGGTRASENSARRQQDRATAKRLWTRDTRHRISDSAHWTGPLSVCETVVLGKYWSVTIKRRSSVSPDRCGFPHRSFVPERSASPGPSRAPALPVRRLDELNENPACIAGVDEVDPRACRATPRLRVEQSRPLAAQPRRFRVDVGDRVGDLLDALASALKEPPDRRIVAQWGKELDSGVRVSDREHCLSDALLLVDLGVHRTKAE